MLFILCVEQICSATASTSVDLLSGLPRNELLDVTALSDLALCRRGTRRGTMVMSLQYVEV